MSQPGNRTWTRVLYLKSGVQRQWELMKGECDRAGLGSHSVSLHWPLLYQSDKYTQLVAQQVQLLSHLGCLQMGCAEKLLKLLCREATPLQGGNRGNLSVQLLPIFSLPASPHREFLPQIPSQVIQLPQWLLKKPIPVMQWPAASKPGYGWGARDPRGTAGQPQVAKLDRPTQNQSVSLAAEGLESRWGLENLMKHKRLYYTTGVRIKIISKAQKYILLQLLPNISLCFEPGLCP